MLKVVLASFVATLAACSANSNSDTSGLVNPKSRVVLKCKSPNSEFYGSIREDKSLLIMDWDIPAALLKEQSSSIDGFEVQSSTKFYRGQPTNMTAQLTGDRLVLMSDKGTVATLSCSKP